MEPRQLQQTDSSSTSLLYYLRWEAPSNIDDVDLGHYQLYANDTLVQRIHADQRYALISLQEGTTTTVKVVAVNKCGRFSNYDNLVSITPNTATNEPHRPQTTAAPTDGYTTTVPNPNVQSDANINYDSSTGISGSPGISGSQQCIANLGTFLALILFTLASL